MITFNNLPAHSITVLSGKGGVGKTTFSIYLATALAKAGKKVLLIDADFSLGKINAALKIKAKYTFNDFIQGERTLEEVIVDGPEGMKIIPAASGISDLSNLSNRKRDVFIKNIKTAFWEMDYIIVDCPAGIAKHVIGFSMATRETVCVCTPEIMSLTDSYSVYKLLKKVKADSDVKFIMNRVTAKSSYLDNIYKIYNAVKKQLHDEIETLGYINECPEAADFELVRKKHRKIEGATKFLKNIDEVATYFLGKYPEIEMKKTRVAKRKKVIKS